MLELIAKALKDYNDRGRAVIKGNEEYEAKIVADYVLTVLRGLKCSYDLTWSQPLNQVTITDRMLEVE